MIDYAFIAELEGNSTTGYVPNPETSISGVTIASGFDLGQRDDDELDKAFEPTLAVKLKPYTGMIKAEAVACLQANPLQVSEAEAETINRYAHSQAEQSIRNQWQNSDAINPFDALPDQCQTVVASVSFQYGNLASRTPNFWRQVTAEDWDGAEANLRNFGDAYGTRRNKEADLLATRA